MATLGYGVTGYDAADAHGLLVEAFPDLASGHVVEMREITNADQIEPNHVRPNMGNFLRRGVWFPKTESNW